MATKLEHHEIPLLQSTSLFIFKHLSLQLHILHHCPSNLLSIHIPSFHLAIHPSVSTLIIQTSIYPSSIHPPNHSSIHPSVHLPIHPFIYPSITHPLSPHPPIHHLLIYLIYPSIIIYPPIYPSSIITHLFIHHHPSSSIQHLRPTVCEAFYRDLDKEQAGH